MEHEEDNNDENESDVSEIEEEQPTMAQLMRVIRHVSNSVDALRADVRKHNKRLKKLESKPASNVANRVPETPKTDTPPKFVSEPTLQTIMRESENFEEDYETPDVEKIKKRVTRQRAPRRESKLIQNLKYHVDVADNARVYTMQTAEPFNLKLTKLTPKAFLYWYTKWNEHTARYKSYTPPTSLVSDEIRETLMLNNDLTHEEFHDVKPHEFIEYVAEEVKCQTKTHYAQVLKESYHTLPVLSFKHVMPDTHLEFQQGVLRRRTYFYRIFDFLNISNSAHVPDIAGEYGLAKIFMSNIDARYCSYVLRDMGPISSFKRIKDFTDAFVKKVTADYEVARAAASLPYEHEGYLGIDLPEDRVATPRTPKHLPTHQRVAQHERKPTSWVDRKRTDYPTSRKIAYMDVADGDPADTSSDAMEDSCWRDVCDEPGCHMDDVDGCEPESLVEDELLLNADIPPDRSGATMGLYMIGSDGQTRPRGCLYYAIFGNCLKGPKCPNADGHTPEARVRTATWLMDKMTGVVKPNPSGPIKFLTKDRSGPK